ncbi:MAG: hypothetical protein U9Q68_04045 [Euryarchaeota archaeon]|nr:hypothetical protein [Euryarchaeota archaeon]
MEQRCLLALVGFIVTPVNTHLQHEKNCRDSPPDCGSLYDYDRAWRTAHIHRKCHPGVVVHILNLQMIIVSMFIKGGETDQIVLDKQILQSLLLLLQLRIINYRCRFSSR